MRGLERPELDRGAEQLGGIRWGLPEVMAIGKRASIHNCDMYVCACARRVGASGTNGYWKEGIHPQL